MSETPNKAGRALSFGAIAKQYDRYRPSPPHKALEWLLPDRVTDALDLAAGTGALSRRLLARADRVIAVEPDERMRALLARRLPQVTALTGRAEELPLPDASIDAILVSSAWHWLDPERAVPEIARVLRPGGTLGILWTGLDREDEAGVAAALWRATHELREASARSAPHRPEDVRLPAGAPFTTPEITRLHVTWSISPERLVGLLGTYSSVITMPADNRARLMEQARLFLATDPRFAGRRRLPVPISCRCWKARRIEMN